MRDCSSLGTLAIFAGLAFAAFCAVVGGGVIGAVIVMLIVGVLP